MVTRVAFANVRPVGCFDHWSGTEHFMGRTMEEAFGPIDYLGPLAMKWGRTKSILHDLILRTEYRREIDLGMYRRMSAQVDAALEKSSADVVFAPGCMPYPNCFLKSRRPRVFWSDATFANLVNIHPHFCQLPKEKINTGHELQKRMFQSHDLYIFATHWAANTAKAVYGADPGKIVVLPFGANLERGLEQSEIASIVEARDRSVCRLLFVCTSYWNNKGGDTALEVCRLLNKSGLKTELFLVGIAPPIETLPENVKYMGMFDKSNSEQCGQLADLFKQSHFVIGPSRSECFGVTFCEASAFAVPSLTSNAGGIPEVVLDGVNGQKFAVDSPASDYADYIMARLSNFDEYVELCKRAHARFREYLCWSNSCEPLVQRFALLH